MQFLSTYQWILVTILMALQIGDIWTTYYVLKKGGRELNPIAVKAMEILGVLPGLIAIKIVFIAITAYYLYGYRFSPDYFITYPLYGLIAFYFYVVVVNNGRIVMKKIAKEKNQR